MIKIPLSNPNPDFDDMIKVLNGNSNSSKVHLVELLIDEEIKKAIIEKYFDEENFSRPEISKSTFSIGNNLEFKTDIEEFKKYYTQYINFYYRLGYSVLPDIDFIFYLNVFNSVYRKGKDPIGGMLARNERHWAQEGKGLIQNWNDFEKFPWKKIDELIEIYSNHLEFKSRILPDGMQIAVIGSLIEIIMEWLLGYEIVLYNVYDNTEFIDEVFNKLGKIMFNFYSTSIQVEKVGVLWHSDDIGYKTGTILSPLHLRKWVFPWFKKYSEIAHQNNKVSWLHSCGNKFEVMNDIISDMKYDAVHSFEDVSYSIIEYKKKYGNEIALLGGIDVDKLARYDEIDLRKHIRKVLSICMTGGKFALGSGNTITNYIPLRNYFIMLEEGINYRA